MCYLGIAEKTRCRKHVIVTLHTLLRLWTPIAHYTPQRTTLTAFKSRDSQDNLAPKFPKTFPHLDLQKMDNVAITDGFIDPY